MLETLIDEGFKKPIVLLGDIHLEEGRLPVAGALQASLLHCVRR